MSHLFVNDPFTFLRPDYMAMAKPIEHGVSIHGNNITRKKDERKRRHKTDGFDNKRKSRR